MASKLNPGRVSSVTVTLAQRNTPPPNRDEPDPPGPGPRPPPSPTPRSLVAIDGDSLAANNWAPTTWQRQMQASMPQADFYQFAVAGVDAEYVWAHYAGREHPLAPVNTPNQVGVLVLVVGTNDMINDTVAAGEAALLEIWAQARADGFRILASTIKPVTDGGAYQDRVVELNTFIRANAALYDALLELDVLFPNSLDATLLYDGLHFTAAGNSIVLAAATPLVLQLLTP